MATMSQNEEMGVVIAISALSGAATYVSALPIPLEWKAPTVSFISVIYSGVLYWWRAKVNNPDAMPPVLTTTEVKPDEQSKQQV